MNAWQFYFVVFFGLFSLIACAKGLIESRRSNSWGSDGIFNLLGAFVWADAAVFGLFWFLISIGILFLNDWNLFLLFYAIFWLVRSLGESIYWFNQQFSTINRSPPETYLIYKIFRDDSVWFVYQIYWQCITVLSAVASLYLGALWLGLHHF